MLNRFESLCPVFILRSYFSKQLHHYIKSRIISRNRIQFYKMRYVPSSVVSSSRTLDFFEDSTSLSVLSVTRRPNFEILDDIVKFAVATADARGGCLQVSAEMNYEI